MLKITSLALLTLIFSACAQQGMEKDEMMMKSGMQDSMETMPMETMKTDGMKKETMKNKDMDNAHM